jgi:hypothetical protein
VKTKLQQAVISFSLLFWPLQVLLTNQPFQITKFTTPAILLFISFFLFIKHFKYYLFILLLIPFFEPKLLVFPLIMGLISLLWQKKPETSKFLILALILIPILWQSFFGQTIFTPDYEAQQAVIRKTLLYPSVFWARVFHSKARIVLDKFNDRIFALTDPNNYFFGFAPRQIGDNQNFIKFPFITLPFFLYGLYHLTKNKNKFFIITSFFAGVLTLSILTIFDRNDFLLWLPLSLVLVDGIKKFTKKYTRARKPVFWIVIIFSLVELIRILIQ